MADLPIPKSFEQTNADMLSSYAAKVGVNDFNVGSAVTSFFEVIALVTARTSGDIFQILKDFSVDRATGSALKRLATENKVTPVTAKPATGFVTVSDSSFTKIASKIYAGAQPPNIGSVQIKVSDASLFPGTGSIYIGRGTPNVEGPLPYTSVTPSGGFFIVNLSVATTKFHNLGESVIVARGGNRSIPVNTIAISPASGASPDVQFNVTTAAVILDGETQVDNVSVSALSPGSSGNVPRGAIKSFAAAPFSGAKVTNPLPFTTGADSETDDQLRVRIKRALASKGLGTATAIKSSVIDATPSDEQATIVSSEIQSDSSGATLYIDDGSGYEAKTAGVGLESIVDSALGGEQFFQLSTGGRQAPVAKAFLESTLAAPFDLIGGDTLAVTIGETTYQHVFATTDFRSPGGATAFEITASINANTLLGFEASTSGGGQYLVLRSKEEGDDSISIAVPTTSGRDASVQLGLPSNEIQTLRLYKNKIPLNKDGKSASVFTQGQQLWSATITNGDTLILSVDGTAFITYTVSDADFISTGLYTSVASTNSLESWVEVFNTKLTGVTVSAVGQQLKISSNLGASNRAKISIDAASTLVTKGMFNSLVGLSSDGKASDFELSRNTAQFKLVTPLVAGDELSAGSNETEARIQSIEIPSGIINFTSDAHIWMLIDSPGEIVQTGVAPNSLLAVSKPSTNVVRFTSNVPSAFTNVQAGDYVIIWSTDLNANDRFEGRVHAVTSTTLDILVTAAEYAAAVTTAGIVFTEGFVIFRGALAPQKFTVAVGTKTLDQIAQELQDQTSSLMFGVQEEQFLVIRSRTKDSSGSVTVITSDVQGKLLGFVPAQTDSSKDSLIAFYDSGEKDGQLPLFIHSPFATEAFANPIASYISSLDTATSLAGRDPNELLCLLHPYGTIADAQAYGETVQETSISGATVGISENPSLKRARSVDRFYVANPLDFGSKDTAVVVADNDTSSKSFEVPFYRRATTNSSFVNNAFSFNAYDVDSGVSANFVSAFGAAFDFSNFKVLMQAKKVLKPSPAKTAILYRSFNWGRSGEAISVGYIYPSSANSPISSAVTADSAVKVKISLKSGAPISTGVTAGTQWNVTIAANTPSAGIDQVTYTWNGTGSNPALTLSGGEYVNITGQTGFSAANDGIFRVSDVGGYTPTSTSFAVQRKNGTAVAESNKATQVSGAITFYRSSNTTALELSSYVNTNLSDYFSATLVNDGGSDGSGVVGLSTFEDSAFVFDSVQLKDGINWIASSNLSGSPQFTFKKALTLTSDVGYAFNGGDELRFIPTTMDQVKRLLNVLAVTGFSTVGNIGVVDRGSKLEFSTEVLGSDGAIQIIGGLANQYQVPVLDSALRLDNAFMQVSSDKVSSQGVHSDQWFRLQATTVQRKDALLSSNSSVKVISNTPSVGQTTIKLLGRALNQRYFGRPRHHVRTRGNTFRVEKQGGLVCMSWNGVGTTPAFQKTFAFNDASGGTLNVYSVSGTSEAEYRLLTGVTNFTMVSIGDLITVSGLPVAANNGTFLVTGVSDDGTFLRVLNPSVVNELSFGTFTLNTNLTAGDDFTIGSTHLIAGTSFAIGGTAALTAANLAAVVGTVTGVIGSVVGSVVKVTALAPAASIALAYSGVGTVTLSGAALAGITFSAGAFAGSTAISEGDTFVVGSPFAVLNQGKFRVIRQNSNSIWYENANVVEEEVALPSNLISFGFDSSTSFKVNASAHSMYVNWNGVGTEPLLGAANMGDVVTFGVAFAAANQGNFMVIRSGVKLPQITDITMPAGSAFTLGGLGKYFLLTSAGDVNKYYIWFNVNGGHSDPGPVVGYVSIPVAILNGDNAATVAAKVATVVNGLTGLTATSSGSTMTVVTTGSIETTTAANVNVPSPFLVNVTQPGRRTFVECLNPLAANQSTVFVSSGVLECHRPQIQFWEYEATVAGDQFVATGDTLGSGNAGAFAISQVIDKDTAILSSNLSGVTNSSLNGRETSVFVQEGVAYSGYKHVFIKSPQPGASTRSFMVFDTNAQYEKVNQSAGVQMTSLNKMDFSTIIRKGLDSYRYNTGLIAEANRIIYGDPRDPTTYSGTGAAGAEIFVREPLTRRIQISVDVRVNTGVPFAQTAEQVRTSVGSLINSNDVGQPIAISAIVSAVNAIPGVKAVSISSPQYDSTHDIIFIAPSEKARIIDPVLDISVSQIGS